MPRRRFGRIHPLFDFRHSDALYTHLSCITSGTRGPVVHVDATTDKVQILLCSDILRPTKTSEVQSTEPLPSIHLFCCPVLLASTSSRDQGDTAVQLYLPHIDLILFVSLIPAIWSNERYTDFFSQYNTLEYASQEQKECR